MQGEPTGQPPKEDAPQASHRPHGVPRLGSAMSRQPPASPAVPWFPTLCLNELLAENELGAAGRQGRREEKTSPQDAVQTASSFLGSLLPDLCAPRGHPGNGRRSWVSILCFPTLPRCCERAEIATSHGRDPGTHPPPPKPLPCAPCPALSSTTHSLPSLGFFFPYPTVQPSLLNSCPNFQGKFVFRQKAGGEGRMAAEARGSEHKAGQCHGGTGEDPTAEDGSGEEHEVSGTPAWPSGCGASPERWHLVPSSCSSGFPSTPAPHPFWLQQTHNVLVHQGVAPPSIGTP